MGWEWAVARFFFGAAIGSFLGVIADRYDPALPLFSRRSLGGRSRCDACGTSLRWYELIPLMSFLAQRGRCHSCSAVIPLRVPLIEIVTGAVFVAAPAVLFSVVHSYIPGSGTYALAALWAVAFAVLILISWIDARLSIIPDEANMLLVALGAARLIVEGALTSGGGTSFAGPYALLFGSFSAAWIGQMVGALAGAGLFGAIIVVTRGRGMGMGDLKLAAALGFLFGWPDILFVAAFAFIIGSVAGVAVIASGRKTLKSAVPFGPFIALGAMTLFFFGGTIIRWYFGLFP